MYSKSLWSYPFNLPTLHNIDEQNSLFALKSSRKMSSLFSCLVLYFGFLNKMSILEQCISEVNFFLQEIQLKEIIFSCAVWNSCVRLLGV